MEITGKQFGLFIAYLLPGFVGLAGLAPLAPAVGIWLQPDALGNPGLGPSIYALVAATAFGLVVSCFRWLIVDFLLHQTGLKRPVWKDQRLVERLDAFDYLVEHHYRYYQFYANTTVALMWAYSIHRVMKTSTLLGVGTDLGVILVCAVLLAGARDTLAKYYSRTSRLIGYVTEKGSKGNTMTNGNHHAHEAGAGPRTEQKPQGKTEVVIKPDHAKAKPAATSK